MVAFSKLCLTITAAVGTIAVPAASSHGPLVKFHELKQIPAKWQSHGQASKGAMIKAQIGLKQGNIKGLQEKLMDISHPDSPNYGKWLSTEEMEKFTAPPAGHVEAVKGWLAAHGIHETSQPTNDWIEFTVPVSKMESLLDAKYEWFSHESSDIKMPRTTKFSVPEALHSMIDLVTPTTAFYESITAHAKETNATQTIPQSELQSRRLAGCKGDGTITPGCINQIYNVDWTSSGSQVVGTAGMLGVGANHYDYASFGRSYVPGLKDFRDVNLGGAYNDGNSDLEGNLDTQHMGGISYPNPSIYMNLGPTANDANSFNDALTNMASYLTSNSNPPSAVSVSYGGPENLYAGNYLDRVCNEFMKVGSRGISVFFSSGDHGVGGNGGTNCNQGFYALWPASCPWITSVGGTQFSNNGETVANFYTFSTQAESPGGGFSWHFNAPDYNKQDTSAFANSLDSSYRGYFNPTGRGYPDISLVSVEYQTYVNGGVVGALGTSASSPAVAALVGVLNDYRKSKGKSTLGFINPLLYSSQGKAAVNDITTGNNYGCGTRGYYAARGWDAASGLGTLDFARLRAAI